MFVDAIEKVASFTRPVNTIVRTYGGKNVIPGSATLFFVNNEAQAVTCKHVMQMLINADNINNHYRNFLQEKNSLKQDGKYKSNLKGLELKYKLSNNTTIQLKNNFVDCVDTMSGFEGHLHPTLDLAIIKFKGFNKIHYNGHAVFVKDGSTIKQGMNLCRLGFPFPEFSNFRYNSITDDIEWGDGLNHSPRFPIDGMITRFLGDGKSVYGIELSTPGLRGQSGGPLFDKNGIVSGMQYSTKHLHLGFDMEEKEIMINNEIKKISDYSFLHLGQCIHSDAIKLFLNEHNVKYYEE